MPHAYFKRFLQDLDHLYHLSVAEKKLSHAIKALELMAKITGILQPASQKNKQSLHLHELSDQQIECLIAELEESSPLLDQEQS